MKAGLSFRTLCVLLFAGLNLPIAALSQDAEKQKIIAVITDVAEAYMQKGEAHIATGFYKKSIELNPNNSYAKEMVEKMSKSH